MRLQLFSHILTREFQESDTKHLSRKFTEWVYGPITCSLYDLANVDSFHGNSVLEILVYGSDIPVSPVKSAGSPSASDNGPPTDPPPLLQNRHEMLQKDPLGQLLESKWKRFAGVMFGLTFLVYLVYLTVFTVIAYNKKEGQVSPCPPPRCGRPVGTHLSSSYISCCSGRTTSQTPCGTTCTSPGSCSPLWQTATSSSRGYVTK